MEDKFFGRAEYLETLKKRVSGIKHGYRQNIAIIGDELIGKTSMICKFLDNFYDNEIVIIYLQIRPETIASFARRFIGVLLYNFLINSGLELKEDLDFLISKSEKYIPLTCEKIKFILNSLSKRKKNSVFSELLSLPDLLNREAGKFCAVIFDEFHNLEGLGIKDLYAEWSKALLTQKNTVYAITSSMKFKAKTVLSRHLTLLFGNFEVMEVEPFDIRTSEQYLTEKLPGLNLQAGTRDFIVHFTGGYPFYLGLITDAMLKSGQDDLVDILENLLFESSGILHQRFSTYLKRFVDSGYSQQYVLLLYLVSSGHNKIKDIVHLMRLPRKDLISKINYLMEFDAISRHGDFLKINDRVFAFWLKYVYQDKLNSLTFDSKNQKAVFRRHIENSVGEFLKNYERPLAEKITELLHQFSDDILQIDKKRIRLDQFREVKPLEFSNKNLREGLIGRSSASLWIIAFKTGILTEDYVAEFAKECKRYRHKSQRKIIVTMKDVDVNARLRALEEKIITWDLNNLNQILDLFSQPRVIA